MHLFIDESGDCGMKPTSAPIYALAAFVLENEAAIAEVEEGIASVRLALGKKANYEFHFTRIGHEARIALLDAMYAAPFQFFAIVLDKGTLLDPEPWREKKFLFENVIGELADGIAESLHTARLLSGKPLNAKVVADDNQDRVYFQVLRERLFALKDQDGRSLISKVKPGRSHTSSLLQLADMVCGAVVAQRGGQEGYLRRIRRKWIEQRPLPETKRDDPEGSSLGSAEQENVEKLGDTEPC